MGKELEIEPSLTEDIEGIYDSAGSDDVDEPEVEVIEEVVNEDGTAVEIAEPSPELEALLAPNSWKKDHHESFGTMSRETQQYILDRESDFERGIGEKGQELAGFRQRLEGYDNALSPLVENWQRQGMDPMSGLTSLIGWSQSLANNPQETLLGLAKHYGIDLTKTMEEQPYVDPATTALENQLGKMQQTIDNFTNDKNTDTQNAAFAQMDAFEQATDSDGNLTNPYFKDVIDDMVMLMKMERATDLSSAYELAVRFSPDIQTKLSEQQADATAHAKTKQAKKATEASEQSVSSSEASEIEGEELSIKEQLAKDYDAAA